MNTSCHEINSPPIVLAMGILMTGESGIVMATARAERMHGLAKCLWAFMMALQLESAAACVASWRCCLLAERSSNCLLSKEE